MAVAGNFRLGEGTVPAWAGAGTGHLYFDQADGNLYFRNSTTGVVTGPLGVGGSSTLQQAYDAGPDILLDATGGIEITDAATNADGFTLAILADAIGSTNAIKVVRQPASPAALNGVRSALGVNASGNALDAETAGLGYAVQGVSTGFGSPGHFEGQGASTTATLVAQTAAGNANAALQVEHAGTGPALNVVPTGSGDGIAIDTTGGSGGDGIQINVLAGQSAINAGVAGSNVLRVDDSECKIGDSGGVVLVQSYGRVMLGSAAGAEAKTFDARTTDAATTLTPANNLGRIVTRAGIETAASTIAELAYQAGSAAEVLLTKGGRLYATAIIREFIIGVGGVAVGEVVAMDAATSTVVKADPVTANTTDNAFGVVIAIEGTGIATERALVAMGGYVDGLAGLTANTPVYLDDTTPGLLTSTVPSASGTTSIRIGFAFSQSSIIIHVGDKVLL